MAASPDPVPECGPARGGFPLRRLVAFGLLVTLVGLVYWSGVYQQLSPETLVRNRADIVGFIAGHRLPALALYVALYIAVIAMSVPVAMFMTIAGGFLFGTLVGGLATIFGATTGAALVFLIARSTLGEALLRRAGPIAARFAAGFRADAFSYLLFLRLVPVPFWLVNLAPAFAGVRLSTFVAATAIGIVPATFTFAFFGAGLDSVIAAQAEAYKACFAAGRDDCHVDLDLSQVLTPTLLAALVALGCLALVPILARRFWRRTVAIDPADRC